MTLVEQRRAISHLLDPTSPADASASYYALHLEANKTQLFTYPPAASRAGGYMCLSRTGLDLFRPLLTMRFPESGDTSGFDLAAAGEMITTTIPEGSDVIIKAPTPYAPLLSAFFENEVEQRLKLLVLDRGRFQPVINVFVTRSEAHDGLPRFVIRQNSQGQTGLGGDVAASAGINWQTPTFAEVYVHTATQHRRKGFGQSVLAACVQHVLDSGRRPLYVVESDNSSSIQLAENTGFVNLGPDLLWLEGRRRSHP